MLNRTRWRMLLRFAAAAVMGTFLAGCDRSAETPTPNTTTQTAPAVNAHDVQALRALGYLDYAEAPADPSQSGVILNDGDRVCPGYVLYCARSLCKAVLIDRDGAVVHQWQAQGQTYWSHAELLDDGDLLVVGSVGPRRPNSGFVARLAPDGTPRWHLRIGAHHDAEQTPSGDILVLTKSLRAIPAISEDLPVLDNQLTRLSPDGQITGRLSFYDFIHAGADLLPPQPNEPRTEGVTFIDPFHANSVFWMADPHLRERDPIYGEDNILVCMRHQDAVAIVNWRQQKLVWAWGQGEISGPHDAHVLASGNILLFDNGLGRGWSRVIEVDPLSRKIVWEYQAPKPESLYTRSHGTCQRLPNGNTLISDADHGRVFEVTADGAIVWDYYAPDINEKGHRATVTRAIWYSTDVIKRFLPNDPDS